MMRLAVLGLIIGFAAPALARDRKFVVLPLDVAKTAGKLTPEAKSAVEEMLRDLAATALTSQGWTVLDGNNTLELLRANNIDPSKCEGECHLETARRVQADAFVSGSMQWSDGEFTASFRLLETGTGKILAAERAEGATAKEIRREFDKKAAAFFGRSGLGSEKPVAAEPAGVTPRGSTPGAPPPSNASASESPAAAIESKSGLEYVPVPSGTFQYQGEQSVSVQAFQIGRTPVTVEAYGRCVRAKGCTEPSTNNAMCNWKSSRIRHPVNCVDWYQAKMFCEWAGGRLPTEQQREYVASGGEEAREYPWGSDPPGEGRTCRATMEPLSTTCAVASHRDADARWGIQDLGGNVWEWTASSYDETKSSPKVVRGGSAIDAPTDLSSRYRYKRPALYKDAQTGFRCVR